MLPCKEESKDWDTTETLYIEGDNLEVLKLLQKSYHNKIKMICIDPPYNTGHDFVYNSTKAVDNIKTASWVSSTPRFLTKKGIKAATENDTGGTNNTNGSMSDKIVKQYDFVFSLEPAMTIKHYWYPEYHPDCSNHGWHDRCGNKKANEDVTSFLKTPATYDTTIYFERYSPAIQPNYRGCSKTAPKKEK